MRLSTLALTIMWEGWHMLKLESLCVNYGPIEAVKSVSLDVGRGEVMSIIGSNGAGKSSLLKCIAGLEPAASGRIIVDGKDITTLQGHRRLQCGLALVPEGRGIFPDQSVEDNLRLGALALKTSFSAICTLLDEQYQLFPRLLERRNQMAGTLSGGEQQMLAICRALMGRPRLILLDEPSLGLAPLIIKDIFRAIVALRESGITVVLVEQMANQALAVANSACLLENGKIVKEGEAATLRQDAATRAAYLGGV